MLSMLKKFAITKMNLIFAVINLEQWRLGKIVKNSAIAIIIIFVILIILLYKATRHSDYFIRVFSRENPVSM